MGKTGYFPGQIVKVIKADRGTMQSHKLVDYCFPVLHMSRDLKDHVNLHIKKHPFFSDAEWTNKDGGYIIAASCVELVGYFEIW